MYVPKPKPYAFSAPIIFADLSRDDLKSHFLALKNYRNSIGHARDMDIVEQKKGEAAVIWFRRKLSALGSAGHSNPVPA